MVITYSRVRINRVRSFSRAINTSINTNTTQSLEDYQSCVSRFSAVNTIDTQLRDPINSGLARWRLAVKMEAVAESGRNPVSKHQIDD